jgi:hypothetical protein
VPHRSGDRHCVAISVTEFGTKRRVKTITAASATSDRWVLAEGAAPGDNGTADMLARRGTAAHRRWTTRARASSLDDSHFGGPQSRSRFQPRAQGPSSTPTRPTSVLRTSCFAKTEDACRRGYSRRSCLAYSFREPLGLTMRGAPRGAYRHSSAEHSAFVSGLRGAGRAQRIAALTCARSSDSPRRPSTAVKMPTTRSFSTTTAELIFRAAISAATWRRGSRGLTA